MDTEKIIWLSFLLSAISLVLSIIQIANLL